MKVSKKLTLLFNQNCNRWFLKIYESKCFTGIDDMPIFLWNKIHETDNVAFVLRSQTIFIHRKKLNVFKEYALARIWRKIYDEYIAEFGFSENYLDIIRKRKEILRYRLQKIVTGDRSFQTFIDVCNFELNTLQQVGANGSFMDTKAYVEKGMGIRINPMECSVKEFYGYVKYLQKESKRASNG